MVHLLRCCRKRNDSKTNSDHLNLLEFESNENFGLSFNWFHQIFSSMLIPNFSYFIELPVRISKSTISISIVKLILRSLLLIGFLSFSGSIREKISYRRVKLSSSASSSSSFSSSSESWLIHLNINLKLLSILSFWRGNELKTQPLLPN